jgi:DNA polymerase
MNNIQQNELLKILYTLKSFGFNYIKSIDFSKLDNKINLPNNIDKLEEIVQNCSLCQISNSTKNKLFLDGDINSKVIFISTYNFSDNKPINTLFDDILTKVLNTKREDILVLHILKCNTNNSDQNNNLYIKSCKDYLYKQLEILNPKLIITLGDSFKYLLNDNNDIENIHGATFQYKDIDLIPLYDLQYLYRNPSSKKDTMVDLQKIKLLMENL